MMSVCIVLEYYGHTSSACVPCARSCIWSARAFADSGSVVCESWEPAWGSASSDGSVTGCHPATSGSLIFPLAGGEGRMDDREGEAIVCTGSCPGGGGGVLLSMVVGREQM